MPDDFVGDLAINASNDLHLPIDGMGNNLSYFSCTPCVISISEYHYAEVKPQQQGELLRTLASKCPQQFAW